MPTLLGHGAQPGSLDPAFDPPASHGGPHPFLVVVGSHLYLRKDKTVQRLTEDGRLDPGWHLKSPLENRPRSLTPLPWGGFVVNDAVQSYLEQADGTFVRMSLLGDDWFPQADGSFLAHQRGARVFRQDVEGRGVAGYTLNARFESVSFVNPSGGSVVGTGLYGPRVVVADHQGRLIAGGHFLSVGGVDRPGLVRLLGDGRPDPGWNPGPKLGIAATNAADPDILANLPFPPPTNFITARPSWMLMGTDDSVVVGIEYVSPQSAPDRRIAVIDARGEVRSVFPSELLSGLARYAVQADGRILLADDSLTTWHGIPVPHLIRVEPDGTLDSTFQVALDPPDAAVSSMTLDDQGRLWISGSFTAVNGVARPGLARLFAQDPPPAPPRLEPSMTRSRIAEGETLHLAAQVADGPASGFQWYRDGVPIPGAEFPGLRLPVGAGVLPAEFQVRTWNLHGTNVLSLGRTELAVRSPRPGVSAPPWSPPLTVGPITRLVPLPDGRVLFGTGSRGDQVYPMVGRLTAEGLLDPTFGTGGLVEGAGRVEDLVLSSDGSVLVVGTFTSLAGSPASGIAELSPTGHRVERNFPELDIPSVTTALELPQGGWILAGRFNRVGGLSRFRMARLKPDLSVDSTFDASATFQPWQVVDVLALDVQGRLLAAGASFSSEGSLTNPVPYGLVRLLPAGTPDPDFQRAAAWGRSLFVEPEGTLVTGLPLQRWSPDGRLLKTFVGNPENSYFWFPPDHRLVRLPDGGFMGALDTVSGPLTPLRRWLPDGRVDDHFQDPLGASQLRPSVTAAAALPDGSVLVALADGRGGSPIWKVAPDSDAHLEDPQGAGGELRAGLFTQPGRRYQVLSQNSLNDPPKPVGEVLEGDGYLSPVTVPSTGAQGYLRVARLPSED
ncbi:MAG: hypothetical protein JNL10_17130 [Verrucomicrobiales bacterium]|nr:hypothetical protein [Verrucomicrobiales bacterium]